MSYSNNSNTSEDSDIENCFEDDIPAEMEIE